MGLVAEPNNIVITDRNGKEKMNLSSQRPVVLSRSSGQFSGAANCPITHWPSGRDNQDTIAFFGGFAVGLVNGVVQSMEVQHSHIVPGYGSAYYEVPDFYLVKVKVTTNTEVKELSLMGSCLVELGVFGVGLSGNTGLATHELHYDHVLKHCVTAALESQIINGSLVLKLRIWPGAMQVQNPNDSRYGSYRNWVSFDYYNSSQNTNHYKYTYNAKVEYDVTLLKIMGK